MQWDSQGYQLATASNQLPCLTLVSWYDMIDLASHQHKFHCRILAPTSACAGSTTIISQLYGVGEALGGMQLQLLCKGAMQNAPSALSSYRMLTLPPCL
jgi:hypothetical protein